MVQNQNVNKVRLYGSEFGARFRPNDRLQFDASLNYTYGEETFDDGSVLPADRIPPLNGRVGIHYDVLPTVWLETYSRFASGQNRLSGRDRVDPRINPQGTAGWATLNLRAGWQPSRHWSLQVDLENLLDKNYREHGSGIDATGINFMASVRTTF